MHVYTFIVWMKTYDYTHIYIYLCIHMYVSVQRQNMYLCGYIYIYLTYIFTLTQIVHTTDLFTTLLHSLQVQGRRSAHPPTAQAKAVGSAIVLVGTIQRLKPGAGNKNLHN